MSAAGLVSVNLGPVVIGIFINTYLYGIGTFQYASYVTTDLNDPLWIKGTVLSLFFLDTFHSSSLIWMAWVYTIEAVTDIRKLLAPVWPYPMTIVVTALAAFLTQLFLSYRTFRLTKRRPLFYASVIAELGTLGLGLVCSAKAWNISFSFQLGQLKPFLTAWLILETAVDLLICGFLLWTLSRSRTGFARSDTVIRRLMRGAVQTGCFAGIFAVTTLILFLTKSDTQLFSLTGIPISRLYSNTLMDTILCRGELRDLVQQTEPTHNSTFGMGSLGPTPSITLQIHKEVEVHRDHFSRNSEAFQLRSPGRPVKPIAHAHQSTSSTAGSCFKITEEKSIKCTTWGRL